MDFNSLLLSMNILFYSYVFLIIFKYGIQPSISESYYRLPRKFQWLFTFITWGYAIPAMIIGLQISDSGLAFLAGSGIALVGAAPAFHKKDGDHGNEHLMHLIGAVAGIVGSQLLISIVMGQWWNTLGFITLSGISYLIPKMKKNILFWVEIFAFISITIGYYLKLNY